YRLVQLMQERRNFTGAEEVLRKFEEQQPLPPELARLGAEIALANNHPGGALAMAQQAVPAGSRDYRDYLWLARIPETPRDVPPAETHLRKAVALAPHTPDTWVALVRHLVRAGQRSAAQSVVHEASAKVPAIRATFTLARCHDALGQP